MIFPQQPQIMPPGGNLMLQRQYRLESGILRPEQSVERPSLTGALMPKAHSAELMLLMMERYNRDDSAHSAWAQLAKTCIEFVEGKQWTAEELARAAEDDRPTLTLNKIAALIRLVMGYFRNNRLDNRFMPSDDFQSNEAVATALSKICKQLAINSKEMYVDGEVFMDGIMGGRGYYDWRLDFERNDFGEIKGTAKDPFTIRVDADADTYDPKKWGHVFETRLWSIDEVEFTFGKGIANLIAPLLFGSGYRGGVPNDMSDYIQDITPWRTFGGQQDAFGGSAYGSVESYIANAIDPYRKNVRVIDCQHYIRVMQRNIVDLETGDREPIPDKFTDAQVSKAMSWLAERCAAKGKECWYRVEWRPTRRVRWTTMIGDIAVYDQWSPYESLTIIPFFPYFRRGATRGMVEDLIDPQREVNKRRSSQVDILTRIAHSGWMFHTDSLEESEKEKLEQYGAAAGLNLEWKGTPDKKPERITPGMMPTGIEKLEEKATLDLKEIAGINDSALGQVDRVQSGRAIEARQRQSVLGLDTYMSNNQRTKNLVGDKKLELIQNHYTEPRIFRVLGDDGKWSNIGINQVQAAGEIINNVMIGRYEVVTDETPLSETFMNAQFEEIKSLIDDGTIPLAVAQDILVDLSSAPQKELLKQRLSAYTKAQGMITADEMIAMQNAGIPVNPAQIPQQVAPGKPGQPAPAGPPGGGLVAPNAAPAPAPAPAATPAVN